MYINYFRKNINEIKNYEHVWIIENDVYYPNSIIDFIHIHESYSYDLMVPEFGVRNTKWCWTRRLKGFSKIYNVGVIAVIMRFSSRFLSKLIDTIDKKYFGYLEAVLPHICIENDLSIQKFMPEKLGVITTKASNPLLKLIKKDITEKTKYFIENKIYHPIKL
jgi:hypothetical protein